MLNPESTHGMRAVLIALALLVGCTAHASISTSVTFDGRVQVLTPDDVNSPTTGVVDTDQVTSPGGDYALVAQLGNTVFEFDATNLTPNDVSVFGRVEGSFMENTAPENLGDPEANAQEFGQDVNGQGRHEVTAVTEMSQIFTNDSLVDRQAVSLNFLIDGGTLFARDMTSDDGTFGAAYLGIEILATGGTATGVLGVGTLLSSRVAGAGNTTMTFDNGLLSELAALTAFDDGRAVGFTWDATAFAFDLGELAPGESINLLYRVISVGVSSGFSCYPHTGGGDCPETSVTFDDPMTPIHVTRHALIIPDTDPVVRPLFVPALALVQAVPIDEFPAQIMRAPLLVALPPPTGVPAPSMLSVGLLGLSGLLLMRRRVSACRNLASRRDVAVREAA